MDYWNNYLHLGEVYYPTSNPNCSTFSRTLRCSASIYHLARLQRAIPFCSPITKTMSSLVNNYASSLVDWLFIHFLPYQLDQRLRCIWISSWDKPNLVQLSFCPWRLASKRSTMAEKMVKQALCRINNHQLTVFLTNYLAQYEPC